MNKNLVKYPIRFGTLLLAGAALVACKKEEFTEKDAWNLENTRLTRLAQLRKTSDSLARVEREGMFKWQRNLDSLDRINAGGRVFYTVIPVNANEAVFSGGGSTGGGRTEEAITGATVTVTQFGRTFVSTNGAVGTVGTNGVFTFPEMRSGEVSVNVTAPNFTQVNYVANLTPDGGIPNNGVINVGNVIPMFELPGTGSNAPTKFAVVRGKAWYEGNLTQESVAGNPNTPGSDFGLSSEERLTADILAGASNPVTGGLNTNTTLVTANIDLERGEGGMPYFHKRFILESNGERFNAFGINVQSGAIQRFAYSRAVSYGQLNATGDYSMLMPASAVGLPIKLNYSEFATNRVYYNDRGALVSSERFLYGPNVVPTAIPTPSVSIPTLEVQAFTTAAAGTVTFTPQTTGTQSTSFTGGSATITTLSATATPAHENRRRGGFYVTAPTVTVAGAGTGATFTANLFTGASGAVGAETLRNLTAAEFKGTVAGTNRGDFEGAFKTVGTITITAGGSGYTASGALSFTRTDIVNNAGFGGQTTGSGAAGGYVNLSTTTPIQVTDGGSNFLYNAVATVSTPNTFTNYLPTVIFTETNQAASADPTVGYTGLTTPVTPATARLFTDKALSTEYTAAFNGVTNNTGAGGVGAIQEVRLQGAGAYPNANLPFVNFSFGETITTSGFVAGSNKNLFVASATNSVVQFNTTLTNAEKGGLFTGVAGGGANITVTPNAIDFTGGAGWGSRYTFVPTVQISPNSSAAGKLGAAATASLQNVPVICTVSSDPSPANTAFGRIVKLQLTATPVTGLTFPAGFVQGTDFLVSNAGTPAFSTTAGTDVFGINVLPNRYGNTLAAIGGGAGGRTVATGSSLNAYSYSASAQTTSDATNLAAAMGGAKSNTTTLNLSTAEYLAGNNMLVVFDAPNNTTVTGRRHAWGVPVFVSNNAGAEGNVLAGARIIDGGSGYNAPVTGIVNFTSPVTARLVPNPWFRTNVPVGGVNTPSNLTTSLQISGVSAGIAVDQDILGFLNSQWMTAQGTAVRPTPTVTRARLVINVTAAGSGYSRAPRFIVSGGGLNLVEYDQTLASTTSGTPLVSTSSGGVIAFNSMIDAAGTVVKVGNGTSVGSFTGATTTGGLTQVKDANGNDVLNTFEFPVDKGPAYSSTLSLNVVEELSTALTRSLNTPAGSPPPAAASGGVGARVIVGATTAVPTGAVTAVRLNNGASAFLSADNANDTQSPVVDIQTGTANAVFVSGYDSPLVPGPRTLVVGGSGTNATVQSWVTLDPRVPQHRRITTITVTSGGTGYGFVRTNSWWRANGGGTTDPRNDNGTAGQAFVVLGGFESGASNNGGQGQTNTAFDALPGMTYVRDVHYGTGRRID